MAEINPPAWMQAGSYPARNDRLGVLSALLSYPGFAVDEATPLRIRQGVKPSYQNYQLKARAASTPNMTVIVSAGYAFIDNHDVGGYGCYVCVNDADKILTIEPAGSTGQYRMDCVVASVYDSETGGEADEWRLEVIQGAYAATAGAVVRPTLPPSAQVIADVRVNPGQTSITSGSITDIRNYSVAAGGVLPVISNITPNRPHPGQVLYHMDTDQFVYGKTSGSTGTLQTGLPGAWSSWVPTWSTTSGTALPSFGNATVDCRYVKINRTVHYTMGIVFGTTTNFGAGASSTSNWTFSLPVPAAFSTPTYAPIGTGYGMVGAADGHTLMPTLRDASSFFLYHTSARPGGTDAGGAELRIPGAGLVDSVTPDPWVSGDRLSIYGTYEAAS